MSNVSGIFALKTSTVRNKVGRERGVEEERRERGGVGEEREGEKERERERERERKRKRVGKRERERERESEKERERSKEKSRKDRNPIIDNIFVVMTHQPSQLYAINITSTISSLHIVLFSTQ